MNASDTISLVLAILIFLGLVLALVIGVTKVRKNRRRHAIEIKQKLLDRIESWIFKASEICNEDPVLTLDLPVGANKRYMRMSQLDSFIDKRFRVNMVIEQERDLIEIAKPFGDALLKILNEIAQELQSYMEKLQANIEKLRVSPNDANKIASILESVGDEYRSCVGDLSVLIDNASIEISKNRSILS